MTILTSILHLVLALTLSPLLMGVINRTKAFFAGRRGQPLLQVYYDLAKLFRKGAVYSRTTTWIFRIGPVAGLAGILVALSIMPLQGTRGIMAFQGDFLLLAYVLGLVRFLTVLAAFDTGSAFEGMGASREVQFSMLAEPVLLLSLGALAACTHNLCLSEIYAGLPDASPEALGPVVLLIAATFFIVLLSENSRIPVDDPNTHLELTMIHEVMVLDHCGVDLGFILYGSALKLWIFASLLVGIAVPVRTGQGLLDLLIGLGGVFAVAILVGVIESSMARLRLLNVPQMLVVAFVTAMIAVLWVLGVANANAI